MRIANPAGINAFFTEIKNMWLERGQNLSGRIPEELSQIPNQMQALPSINPVSYSLPLVAPAPQQQGHAISLEDMQKAIQNALTQQKTENQALVKKVTELESQMAKQMQVPAPQTVEPVRQPRGPPSSLQTEEGIENYRLSQYLNNLGIFSTEDLERNYPIKPFQRSFPRKSNVSARIDRVEELMKKIVDMMKKTIYGMMILKKKRVSVNENLSDNSANPSSDLVTNFPETYDQLLSKLSPTMRKMCQSHIVQKKESKSDEWFSSLQYLNANINDLLISNSFLDCGSEFGGLNDATINALGWKADKPSDFGIKGNSKHITESLGWFTDVPVNIKDKDGKTVTATGNFARIDNGEPKPMLCLGMTWIRKVQEVCEPEQQVSNMYDGRVLAERCSQLTEAKMNI
ncbi:9652_t:CDS:2 [Ambispora gerdemannii]|uniref:9652_t:CDS:1 n=1 Tax=Ambispora gerdemannii TaxID=144530 RepID=A0A9N9GLJ3_9GLOM|nr:9652_t:CDS:2 [Ambispora gerdemannii]